MRGCCHHEEMAGAKLVEQVRLPGYFLVRYEQGYPAMVCARPDAGGPASGVRGEVYEVAPAQLASLDEFEDCPLLYQRCSILAPGGYPVWAYLIPVELAQKYSRIDSWNDDSTVGV